MAPTIPMPAGEGNFSTAKSRAAGDGATRKRSTSGPRVAGPEADGVRKSLSSLAAERGLDAAALQLLACDDLDPGALLFLALKRARIPQEQAAEIMGISGSLFSRQLQNVDNQHVSWQRLFKLPHTFWQELWDLVFVAKELGKVIRRYEYEVK